MKRFLFPLLISLFVCLGCSDDDNEKNKEIEVADKKELNQKVYADAPSGEVTFTAENTWEARVFKSPTVKASNENEVTWIKLNEYSGKPGTFTLKITLETNYTGENRSAVIEIICGDDKITVTVTQDAKTEKGEIPEEPEEPNPDKPYITKINGVAVHYDENNHVIGYGDEMYLKADWTVKGGQIGGGGSLIYMDKGKESYSYDVGEYVKEIRYYPDIMGSPKYFIATYNWDSEGNMISITGDQIGVSRQGYLRTTFEYTDKEYALGNLDVSLLLSGNEYFVGPILSAFDNNLNKRTKKLVSKARQLEEVGDKYNATITFRYVFNENGYITEVYSTRQYDYEASPGSERLVYSFEYESI